MLSSSVAGNSKQKGRNIISKIKTDKSPFCYKFALIGEITNQKQILMDYAKKNGYLHPQFFIDDGFSGTTFNRPDFQRMQAMVERGEIGTIIVKDVSRFGREQVEMGRLTQVVYPSLGVTFIAIQENVNSTTGEGMEMLPFYSIFNEWYAAQTSKKIRAVNELKASQGKRVSAAVPYGYKKIKDDKSQQWYIDEPAAEVVRKIFNLCLAGRGPLQIAKQLEDEKILTPTAYFHSIERKASNPMPENIYGWRDNTIEHILSNQQYTGCTVNGKTTTISYKVHTVIERSREEYQVIPNTQEPIISENVWLRVQELRSHKRRICKTGRTSLFSGLVYCADCGAKLHFCAAKSLKKDQEFFRCSNYKSGRGKCTIHFIRDVVLEQLVLDEIQALAEFVKCYGAVFYAILEKKKGFFQQEKVKNLKSDIESCKKRIAEIDKLFARSYEDNVLGRLDDNRYTRLAADYNKEQTELIEKLAEYEKELAGTEQKTVDAKMLFQGLMEFLEVKKLTPEIINKLIQRIEVHNPEKKHAHNSVKIDITFTAIGLFEMPEEQELLEMAQQMKKSKQSFKSLSA